ncbi:hybrid sensor histidine kinase/response regulator [Proteiniphilum sp. X52]|uniref:hybrid sensor histidine kinase/response regulator n=1 Tax=Proteiniphilum sp. X52 TaxID=2382159 RepID=UPI001313EF11|nr:hybrid sensor histidine kinase/response regulator [Proteiniphilum sp. X52]
MEQKKSPEQRVRIKIGLIFLVVILYFSGLFVYSYSLKKNMDLQKSEMDNSYKVLSRSNQLIVSIQQAQNVLNMYLSSPRRVFQQQYDSISSDISLQILHIKDMKREKEQDVLLQDIDSLLQEKNRIVRRLTGLFRSQNPLTELDEKISSYDEIIQDSVTVITSTDTTKVVEETPKKGFWNRLRNVFDPQHTPDTTINIIRIEQEARSTSRVDTSMYADLKNITEEASKSYLTRIQGIEREVRELLVAEQNISLHISQLTNEFYNETIRIAWRGTENSEKLTQRIFRFAIVVGALSIFFILIIIFFITDDLNKGQKARADLVKEKQLTEELIESRHKLLLAVSHDVKTPLSSMMGYMEMWDSEESDENKKRQLRSARNSGKHILNMLTNLLEFSRLQQNSAKLHYSQFDLIELMEDIIRMFQPLTDEKSLDLKWENLASSPLYINTDYTILKQILTNVVSNAVKYTLQGSVVIRLQNKDQLVFTVIDSGIGIDSNELPEIFKPFSRMQNPLKAEGSGFGMYVTKGLVDLLNGTIAVTSEKGKGTCVTISLPIRQLSGKDVPGGNGGNSVITGSNNPVPKEMQFHKILVFEDDVSLGNMIREYLVRNGHKVKLCGNPDDVNGFLRVISLFDIVFTDMQMTKITGTDILREIRKRDSSIPVWLMTAHDDYSTERALSEGFSGLIRKPIRMSGIADILSKEKKILDKEKRIPDKERKTPAEEEKNHTGGDNVQLPEKMNSGDGGNALSEKFPQLSALFQEDEESIKEILASFVGSATKDMDILATYIEEGDFEKAQQLSHRIHPFLSQLDADHMCVVLRKMDRLRGEDESSYPHWKEELLKTVEEIRKFTVDISNNYLS